MNEVDDLTPEQIATIPNSYEFSRMSVERGRRWAPEQVQALQVDKVSIGYLTSEQVGHLTTDQIEDLRWSDFRFLSVNEVDDLTPEQIATIPNSYEFSRMSVEARAALSPEQVQALQVDKVSIGYLTGAQVGHLTTDQIEDLRWSDFRFLSVNEVDDLTPEQIATIPNSYEFSRMSAEARAALSPEQVQALQVDKVSIGYLTSEQVEHLTTDQIQSLRWSDFRFVTPARIPELTPAQVATIPNSYEFSRLSVAQRDALTHDQIRALGSQLTGVTFIGSGADDVLTGNTNINNIQGGAGNDVLFGGTWKNVLVGGDGDDLLRGGAGDDLLDGGAGFDTADYSKATGGVVIDLTLLGPQDTISAGVDTLLDIERVIGSAYDDTFSFAEPTIDAEYYVDGNGGVNTIALPQFTRTDVEIDRATGTLRVQLPGGEAFTIHYTNVQTVTLANGQVVSLVSSDGDEFTGTGPGETQPVAPGWSIDAGQDLAAEELEEVTLGVSVTGVGFSNTGPFDAAELTYEWVQTGGPRVELSDPHAAHPTFQAPEGLSNSTVTFEVRVSYGSETLTDTVTVLIHADNDAPTADAGPDLVVNERELVRLHGQGNDPEGQELTYEWVQTGGPEVTLSDPHAPDPTFTAPEGLTNTEITFELRISDGTHVSSDTVTITVHAENDAPTAHAGPDLVVHEREPVQLLGHGSDPEGVELTYEWIQTGGPNVQLSDPHAAQPTFIAPEGYPDAALTFELRVSDGTNLSIDTVRVTVRALPVTPPAVDELPTDNPMPPTEVEPATENEDHEPAVPPAHETPIEPLTPPRDAVAPAEVPPGAPSSGPPTVPATDPPAMSPVAPVAPSEGGQTRVPDVAHVQAVDAAVSPQSATSPGGWDGNERLAVLDPMSALHTDAGTGAAQPVVTLAPHVLESMQADDRAAAAEAGRQAEAAAEADLELTAFDQGQRFEDLFVLERELTLADTAAGLTPETAVSGPETARRNGESPAVESGFVPLSPERARAETEAARPPAESEAVDTAVRREGLWAALWALVRGQGGANKRDAELTSTEAQQRGRRD
ncbi:MAG: hypothetical protein IPM18_14485 [Phycisphaerales bacterium]|nr:hypothetical protein [Phycisphaerales bacterium]